MATTSGPGVGRGSAVLVHGMWSNPEDWLWVRRSLEDHGVVVVAPDLPSHRSREAGLLADADEVRRAIRACRPPVVVVGSSYGASVISVAAEGERSVARLVYVASVPKPVSDGGSTDWLEADPHIIVRDGTELLDNDWWLEEEVGTTFPAEVLAHLRAHPRRAASLYAETDPQPGAAWQTIPTTVLLGGQDDLVATDRVRWARETFSDVRVLNCDHFIQFRDPDAVASAVLEALEPVDDSDR